MADRLRCFKAISEPTDEQFVQFEKDVFLGFYSVRKLFGAIGESHRCDQELEVAGGLVRKHLASELA